MPKARYHRGSDPWGRNSWSIPGCAVAGTSYCGEWEDSPARKSDILPEIKRLRSEVLRPLGIRSRLSQTQTGNLFCAKIWVCVPAKRHAEALAAVDQWLNHSSDSLSLRFLHDAF